MANTDPLFLLLKSQVNVDFNSDDTYLEHLLAAAKELVCKSCNRTSAEIAALGEGGTAWPASLQHAALMTASHWYNQREAVSAAGMQTVPLGFDALVKPWRVLIPVTPEE